MKKVPGLILFALSIIFMSSCEEKNKHDYSYENFKNFVCERSNQSYHFSKIEWDELETKYQKLHMVAEIAIRNNQSGDIAEFVSVQKDWDNFKSFYNSECVRREKSRELEALCNELLPPGVSPDLNNVEASNLKDVQLHFMNVIDAHKHDLTVEQWDYINSLSVVIEAKIQEFAKRSVLVDKSDLNQQIARFNILKEQNKPVTQLLAKYD